MKEQPLVRALLAWFEQNARDLPWRRTRDPYAIHVSEIMLQQTQVKTVLPYWQRWMQALPTLQDLAAASPERVHKLWEGLGYYSRVRNLQKAAQLISRKHEGVFPSNFEAVLALPGVGRYTAGAICSIAFNQPEAILDGNVMRVLARLFGIEGDPRGKTTNAQLWQLAAELVTLASKLPPSGSELRLASNFNQALMELGALVCLPRQPQCQSCPVAARCVARAQKRVEELPATSPRPTPTPRRFLAFVARKGESLLVRQRPPDGVNAHLWEFPNIEAGLTEPVSAALARQALGFTPSRLERLCSLKHSITRYRITLEAYEVLGEVPGTTGAGQWRPERELKRLPFTGAHKKILSRL